MRSQAAVALLEVAAHPAPAAGRLDALRQRFARATSREEVEIDFLEDDLRQASRALGAVNAYLARLERALGKGRMGGGALGSLALAGDPLQNLEELSELLTDVQRRLLRLGRGG